MRRFQFPFERLLQLRNSQLEIEKTALGVLYRERSDIQRSIDVLQRSGEQASRDILRRTTVTGLELEALSRHRTYVAAQVVEAGRRMRNCEERIGVQRERVVKAERACKLFERLREREMETWTYEMNREQEATAGELYLASWSRK